MIVLSNSASQTLAPGATITFDDVLLHTGCGECHRQNTGSVKLRANGIYEVNFSANISGATASGPAQLVITIGESPLLETTMQSSVTGFNNVSTSTAVKNCCGDYDRVAVKNSGTTTITVGPNSVFFIKRVS